MTNLANEVRRRRKPAPIALRAATLVQPNTGEAIGCLVAATPSDSDALRAKRLAHGERVFAVIKKPRNPGFHRLAHAIGKLVAENIEAFDGMDAHRALKRLQIESGAACEEIRIDGGFVCRIPMSLAYDSLDEGEFREAMDAICKWIAKRYWPDCTPEQIEAMADAMVEA